MSSNESMQKQLDELIEATYKAGLLHGQGLLGTPQHREVSELSKKLYQQVLSLLRQNETNP